MREQIIDGRFHGPTAFMAAERENIAEGTAEQWKNELDKPCVRLFEEFPKDDRNLILDTLHAQGLDSVRDVLLLDLILTEAIPAFAILENRQRIARKLIHLPWKLNQKPSIEREERMCTALSDIPLQMLSFKLFDERRHLLIGNRRVTVADALARTQNFETLHTRADAMGAVITNEADSIHSLAIEYADKFNTLKGFDSRRGENPHRI